jgi:hypothetical protein
MVGSFRTAMEGPVRLTMRDYMGLNSNWNTIPIPFDAKSFQHLYRKLCNGKVYSSDQQNRARMAARTNLANIINSAAVYYSVRCDDDLKLSSEFAIKFGLTFSEDTFAAMIGNFV